MYPNQACLTCARLRIRFVASASFWVCNGTDSMGRSILCDIPKYVLRRTRVRFAQAETHATLQAERIYLTCAGLSSLFCLQGAKAFQQESPYTCCRVPLYLQTEVSFGSGQTQKPLPEPMAAQMLGSSHGTDVSSCAAVRFLAPSTSWPLDSCEERARRLGGPGPRSKSGVLAGCSLCAFAMLRPLLVASLWL